MCVIHKFVRKRQKKTEEHCRHHCTYNRTRKLTIHSRNSVKERKKNRLLVYKKSRKFNQVPDGRQLMMMMMFNRKRKITKKIQLEYRTLILNTFTHASTQLIIKPERSHRPGNLFTLKYLTNVNYRIIKTGILS